MVSSKRCPLVSGSLKYTHKNEIMAKDANSSHIVIIPSDVEVIGKKAILTMKFVSHIAVLARLDAVLLNSSGIISDSTTTGLILMPMLKNAYISKNASNTNSLPTNLWKSCIAKQDPNNTREMKTAGSDQSKIPLRPIISIKNTATIDPKKFASAIGKEASMA